MDAISILKILKIVNDEDINNEQKYYQSLEILEVEVGFPLNDFLNEILLPRFPMEEKTGGVKLFCYEKDSDLIYSEFRKMGIDLFNDGIHWWEFCAVLESLFLGENSLTKRIGFRGYVAPKPTKYNKQEISYNNRMKRKYSLSVSGEMVDNGLGGLFSKLKGMAKEKGGG